MGSLTPKTLLARICAAAPFITLICLQSTKVSAEELMKAYPLTQSRAEQSKLLPSDAFVSDEKIKLFTPDRMLYRGTSLELAKDFIELQKIPASKTNVMGWGLYFLPGSPYGAQTYAQSNQALGRTGVVLPVRIRDEAKVLDWENARFLPYFKEMLLENNEASNRPLKTFQIIANKGVDVVIHHGEWIVLNPASIDPPKDVQAWVDFYRMKAVHETEPQAKQAFSDVLRHLEDVLEPEENCIKKVLKEIIPIQ